MLWEKVVNRNRHQDDPVLKVNNKNFKTAIVLEFKEKDGHNKWTDREMCQQNRNHEKEPNGNSRTEKYSIWKNNKIKTLNWIITMLKTAEESIDEIENRNI